MMLRLTDRERAVIYAGTTTMAWNGPGCPLVELFESLGLMELRQQLEYDERGNFNIDKLPNEPQRPFEISKPAAQMLRAICERRGQSAALAVMSDRICRRL